MNLNEALEWGDDIQRRRVLAGVAEEAVAVLLAAVRDLQAALDNVQPYANHRKNWGGCWAWLLAVDCPSCGAIEGDPCHTWAGRTSAPHTPRTTLAHHCRRRQAS